MLIRLDSSLARSSVEDLVELVSFLYSQHLLGTHLVLCDDDIIYMFDDKKHSETRRKVKVLSCRRQDFSAISKELKFVFVIKNSTNNFIKSNKTNEIFISFRYAFENRNSLFLIPSLICEDITDGVLYLNIATLIFEDIFKLYNFSVANIPGGGSNTFKLLRQKQDSGEIFICLLDSDKNCRKCAVGSTAKKALKEHQINNSGRNIFNNVFVLDESREIENLISPTFYEDCMKLANRKDIKISELINLYNSDPDLYRFIDLKNGVQKNLKCSHNVWSKYNSIDFDKISNASYYSSKTIQLHDLVEISHLEEILRNLISMSVGNYRKVS